jgi:hypothetical protein
VKQKSGQLPCGIPEGVNQGTMINLNLIFEALFFNGSNSILRGKFCKRIGKKRKYGAILKKP